jgi:signal transduction histidine kinase
MRERARLLQMTESLAESGRRAGAAQEELLKRRHLASVGAMAAGAAHEINNPLAIISGRAQILAESEQDAERRRSLQVIAEQAERASGVISELMTFSRPLAISRAATDIGLLLKKAVERRTEKAASKGVELAASVPEGLPPAAVDGRQLQWAIEELLDNALAATAAGGRVALEADYDQAARSLVLSVADSGAGMDHETLARARDPFFSGRPAGRGRGFGLAKVQRIAEAHQASFQLESAVGQGTIARLVLDLARAPQEAKVPINGAV